MLRIIGGKYYGITSLDHLYPIPILIDEIFIHQIDFSDYRHLLCKYQPYNRVLIFRDYESYPNEYSETKQLCITIKMFIYLVLSSNVEHATKMIISDFYKKKNIDIESEKFDKLIKELKIFTKKLIKLTL